MSYNKMMKRSFKTTKYPPMGCNYNIKEAPKQDTDTDFYKTMKAKNKEQRAEYWRELQKTLENWNGSYLADWCIFIRNFTYNNQVF